MSNELPEVISAQSPTTLGGIIVSALVGAAWLLPKMINNYKSDINTGTLIERVTALEKRSKNQDNKIHNQQVRITRLVSAYIKLEAHLEGKNIPEDLMKELEDLINYSEDEKEQQ